MRAFPGLRVIKYAIHPRQDKGIKEINSETSSFLCQTTPLKEGK